MRVNGRTAIEAARLEKAAHRGLVVREIDEERTVERIERAREQGAGDGVVIGNQRAQLAGERPSRPSRKPAMRPARSATSSAAGSRPRRPASIAPRSAPKAAAS